MNGKLKIFVFHRNCLFRDCLAAFLSNDQRYDAVAVDHMRAEQAWKLISEDAQVVLLDLNLPDNLALQTARAVREGHLDAKVIVIVPDEHDRLVDCITAGAHGCVLERSPLSDLELAITKVIGGETFCSEEIVAKMFSDLTDFTRMPSREQPSSTATSEPATRPLTLRERDVLALLDQRKSNKEIASELSVSLFTVKNHVHNILSKLNVENRQDAAHLARQQQLLGRFPSKPPAPSQ